VGRRRDSLPRWRWDQKKCLPLGLLTRLRWSLLRVGQKKEREEVSEAIEKKREKRAMPRTGVALDGEFCRPEKKTNLNREGERGSCLNCPEGKGSEGDGEQEKPAVSLESVKNSIMIGDNSFRGDW